MDYCEPPGDLTLKASIQSAALNSYSNLSFKRSVANNPAYQYIHDKSADGHEYYKFCLEACHVQSPNSVNLNELMNKYKEPSISIPMLRDAKLLDFEKKINGIFSTAKISLSRLIEAQASIEASVACVKAVASFRLPAFVNDENIPKLFRRKIEQEYMYSGRLTYSIIAFILMAMSDDWNKLFKSYIPWILRLTDVSATTQHHHSLVVTLLSLFRMENLVNVEEHVNILTIMEAAELPGVSQIFNDHQGLSGTRKKYTLNQPDVVSQENPPEQDSVNPPTLTIDPDYIYVGSLAKILRDTIYESKNSSTGFIPYTPLNPEIITKKFPILEVSAVHLNKRLSDLMENIDFELKAGNTWSSSRKSLNTSADQNSVFKRRTHTYRDQAHELFPRKEPEWEKTVSWAQEEMGVSDDGSLLGRASGEQRLGLGANSKSATSPAEELYEHYRRQRAHKYHKSIAQAHSERQTVSDLEVDLSRICCICQQPGHFARECKFGLT